MTQVSVLVQLQRIGLASFTYNSIKFINLQSAEWKLQWVGLRPSRKSIRVERESKELKNGLIEVINSDLEIFPFIIIDSKH